MNVPCPLCQEEIHPAADRCKHCGGNVYHARSPIVQYGGRFVAGAFLLYIAVSLLDLALNALYR